MVRSAVSTPRPSKTARKERQGASTSWGWLLEQSFVGDQQCGRGISEPAVGQVENPYLQVTVERVFLEEPSSLEG